MSDRTLPWLEAICDPHHRKPVARHPWTLPDGAGVMATDTRLCVVALGLAGTRYPTLAADNHAVIAPFFAPTGPPLATLDMATLRAFAGPHEVPRPEPCLSCKATGREKCPECSQDRKCSWCDGAGSRVVHPDARPGLLYGTGVDLGLLAKIPADCAGPVAVRLIDTGQQGEYQPGTAVVLRGDNWLAALMCLDGVKPVPVFPPAAN